MLLGSHESKANRASRVQGGFRFTITTYLLLDGSNSMASEKPTFVVEGGVENYNPAVEQFIESGFLKRVLVDKAIPLIDFDDRVVVTPEEAQGVYQNQFDFAQAVYRVVALCVQPHNMRLPYPALRGQTREECYLGNGTHIPYPLKEERLAA